ncbi:MAG TPA: CoA-transferase [Candidatus Hydrogenedentes bacterium]|nr:CoA-transferase [Candidatus Hydrogenedentota bacterium]HPG66234.1 CoA-transferase [Candidatus Hydrogenedentota bacterium]
MAMVVSADEAVGHIRNGATVLVNPVPSEEVFSAFGRVFEATGAPRDLTVVYAAGLGPFSEERRGMNHFAYPGMLKRVVAGHVGLNYVLAKMVAQNECEAYNLPQGTMTQLYREIAGGRPGLVTSTGLGTFVDPRIEGGKLNERTKACEDLVEIIQVDGRDMLFYRSFPVDVGIVRGTSADPKGNITGEDEAITMENLEVAMAAKNSGGMVIAQVERVRDEPAHPKAVTVPGVLVDYVVVASSKKMHPHTLFVDHDPSYTGAERADLARELKALPLNSEKVIVRRAAMELRKGMIANLGVGIPMSVAAVAFEEGLLDSITLNTEVGVMGGLPQGGLNFGPAKNPDAFISQPQMFDFYEGGGLDVTCVGMAQVDREGNVNVSKLGTRTIGAGGFINITQSARKCCLCGEFTAGGLDTAVENGRMVIRRDGTVAKFVEAVHQITFSGKVAREKGQAVLYITERCVFRLVPEGLLLAEVAPGVDIERDILNRMDFRPIVPDDVAPMPAAAFGEGPMGLAGR